MDSNTATTLLGLNKSLELRLSFIKSLNNKHNHKKMHVMNFSHSNFRALGWGVRAGGLKRGPTVG